MKIPWNVKVEPEMLRRMKAKAGMRPLSKIVRRLIEMWLDGEIELTPAKDKINEDEAAKMKFGPFGKGFVD